MLFVDLVGFTAASEGRDSEDTRELLSRYFDVARTVIERYGGTVEKFIGDAVMAVWGAPIAQEDDAERAVRAALDLTAAIPELDPLLRARAGILTGEAAVTLGATNQGMVAGDLVNTASRIQSAAEPGTVLTGEATKRATEATIAYEDAGEHEMKGKTEPVQLWRAMRVVAGRGGAMRSSGLEAPFVGRNRELQLVKDLFHASDEEKRAQLVLVSGIAGIGKSRLAWEFEKYIDGLAADAFWHRGRCLSYGEGVAYWALAEMVRGRCGIVEDEDAASAGAKLDGDARGASPRRGGAPLGAAAPRPPPRPRGRDPGRRGEPLLGLAHALRATGRDSTRRCCSSRTSSGPTRACSTSSSTSSTGRAASRSTCSRSPGPSSPRSARRGPASAATRSSTSSRCPRPR